MVSAIRRTEVAADSTARLAVEATVRRQVLDERSRSSDQVALATIQRVTRAKTFEGPRSFAHFTLLGLVTAGRDVGNHDFEAAAGIEAAENPSRTYAPGYYPSLCSKLFADLDDAEHEHGDGGLLLWTQALLANRKERLMISGLSIDRLAPDR